MRFFFLSIHKIIIFSLFFFMVGCSHKLQPIVTESTTAKPVQLSGENGSIGTIYQPERYRSLFGDNLPSQIGDNLTVVIQERAVSSLSEDTRGNRSTDINNSLDASISVPFLSSNAGQKNSRNNVGVSGRSKSNGNASRMNNSSFISSISVTVVNVLPNGYLQVSGEKQIQINNDQEMIKLSGVVDPRDIQPGNTVSSTKLTDVRLEQQTEGQHRQYTNPGWLTQFFMSVSPF